MKKAPLVCQYLENVSRELLSEYREVIGSERALGFRLSALGTTTPPPAVPKAQCPWTKARLWVPDELRK